MPVDIKAPLGIDLKEGRGLSRLPRPPPLDVSTDVNQQDTYQDFHDSLVDFLSNSLQGLFCRVLHRSTPLIKITTGATPLMVILYHELIILSTVFIIGVPLSLANFTPKSKPLVKAF